MLWTTRRVFFVAFIIVLVIALIGGTHWLMRRYYGAALPANAPGAALSGSGPITIILAPNFGDAALSLGGLLAKHERPTIVATFFTGQPLPATTTPWDQAAGFTDSTVAGNVRVTENQQALAAVGAVSENYGYVSSRYGQQSDTTENSITQDIQALLIGNALLGTTTHRDINIYGPADFGTKFTDADTQILHDAYTNMINGFPASNIHFFYYEAYPSVAAFNANSVGSLQKFLQNDSGFYIQTATIPLSNTQVSMKIFSIRQYQSLVRTWQANGHNIANDDRSFTFARCAGAACEVVYEITGSSE